MTTTDREQLDRIRDRFTRTAERFADFALGARHDEAERLASLALKDFPDAAQALALDLACGPGTFLRGLGPHVRFILGLDLTAAMLARARAAARDAGLDRAGFAFADANTLPLADASLDLAVCGYSLHHFLHPERIIRELARVIRRGGRVAIADLIVPDGADSELNNRIERTRDPSHARTLATREIHSILETAGLRVRASETSGRPRNFDQWMEMMDASPGKPAYAEARRLMLSSIPGDRAGFHPRLTPGGAGDGLLEYVQTILCVVAEKH